MNNYGIVMRQMGLHELILDLQVNYLHPISAELFPLHSNGGFSSHHSFIVSYSTDKDTHLDMHTDDSDVTFNICLGNEGFTASGLTFCGIRGQSNHRKFSCSYQHHIGHAVVHLGEQRHGADVITMPPKVINQINGFGKSSKIMTLDTVKGFLTDSKKSRFSL